jgi:hypothetical protein
VTDAACQHLHRTSRCQKKSDACVSDTLRDDAMDFERVLVEVMRCHMEIIVWLRRATWREASDAAYLERKTSDSK